MQHWCQIDLFPPVLPFRVVVSPMTFYPFCFYVCLLFCFYDRQSLWLLNSIYFAFLFSNFYIRLQSIHFVLLLVCYFAFMIGNKRYGLIEYNTDFQNEFREEWRKWLAYIMYKVIEKWRRKCVASCTFRRLFFKLAHKGYLPTKVGKISSRLRY